MVAIASCRRNFEKELATAGSGEGCGSHCVTRPARTAFHWRSDGGRTRGARRCSLKTLGEPTIRYPIRNVGDSAVEDLAAIIRNNEAVI